MAALLVLSDTMSSQSLTAPRPGSQIHHAVVCSGAARPLVEAWVRWCHEVSRIPTEVSDPGVAERKLQWWMTAVAEGFQQAPQHPSLKAMAAAGGTLHGPAPTVWQNLLVGLVQLTQQTRWLDTATLEHHARMTTGAACEGWAVWMGAQHADTHVVARELGVALRWGTILIRLGQDTRQGWLHLPIDHLQAHDVKAHEVLRPADNAPVSPAMVAMLSAWREAALRRAEAAKASARSLPVSERRALRPLIVWSTLQAALLADIHQQGYPILTQRLSLGPWRKAWLSQVTAWRW